MVQQAEQRTALKRQLLSQALEEALEDAEEQGQPCNCLSGAAEVAAALDALRLSTAASGQQEAAECNSSPRGKSGQHDWLAGPANSLLGVRREELAAQLPNAASTQAAVRQLLPVVERKLAERCRQVAIVANYDGSSYEGLADHLQQLCASADRRPEARSWAKGADMARAAVQGLQEANETLAGIVGQHKLGVHKEAAEAKAAYLAAHCRMLLEKLRVVEGQLQGCTYTPATLPALRSAAGMLGAAVAEVEDRLKQAGGRLAQCRALGPRFEALAREHAAVEQQIAETQYQLHEVEQFAQLQRVIG